MTREWRTLALARVGVFPPTNLKYKRRFSGQMSNKCTISAHTWDINIFAEETNMLMSQVSGCTKYLQLFYCKSSRPHTYSSWDATKRDKSTKNLITLAQSTFCKIENQGNLFIVSFRESAVLLFQLHSK
jgi:hypothetical protein